MSPAEVDADDSAVRDSAELAIAYGVTQAVLDNARTGRDSAEVWIPIIGHAIAVPLSAYLRSTLLAFALAIPGRPRPDVAATVKTVTGASVKRIAGWAAEVADRPLGALTPPGPGNAPPATAPVAPVAPGAMGARIGIGSAQIVRSTLTSAREQARYGLAAEMGAVFKVWRTRKDPRVRSTHGALEGTAVPYESEFVTLSGSTLRYPGDPDAPLSETAGCRCRLAYRLGASPARSAALDSGPGA